MTKYNVNQKCSYTTDLDVVTCQLYMMQWMTDILLNAYVTTICKPYFNYVTTMDLVVPKYSLYILYIYIYITYNYYLYILYILM